MANVKKSGPAIFMYCVIALAAVLALLSFILYYGKFCQSQALLWTGVTAFTVMYHLWLRLIMGNVTKLLRVRHFWPLFRELPFEKGLYRFLRVKQWKDKALTYNPELFSLKDYSLEDIANTTAKAELDHWVNELISLSTLLFALIWGEFWIFGLTAFLAMLFDAQFILIQRYNRPRLLRLMKLKTKNVPIQGATL